MRTVLKLFKSGDDLYTEGIDLIKRKEYKEARKVFQKAIDKEGGDDVLASVYIGMINLSDSLGEANDYRNLIPLLSNCNRDEFEFGLTTIVTSKFITECQLALESIRATNMGGDAIIKGKEIIAVGQRYQAEIGTDNLKTVEMFRGDTTQTGIKEGMIHMAIGYETMAQGYVQSDPKKAAEMLQAAYNYRKQIGDSGENDLKLIREYSRSAQCWICGRSATGEGIHFMAMSSDISPLMRKEQDELLKSASENFESIYVCRPCYTAISRRADGIARGYHEQSMQEMRAMEARLRAEIAAVRSSVAMMR